MEHTKLESTAQSIKVIIKKIDWITLELSEDSDDDLSRDIFEFFESARNNLTDALEILRKKY